MSTKSKNSKGSDSASLPSHQSKLTTTPEEQLLHFPYPFPAITRVLTFLYGSLFSFSLNFIVHHSELGINESNQKHSATQLLYEHIAWTIVGLFMSCNQLVTGLVVNGSSWNKTKKVLFVLWLIQVMSSFLMYTHFFLYHQEFHKFYHGLYTSMSVATIFLHYTYFKRRAESEGYTWGPRYLCCAN